MSIYLHLAHQFEGTKHGNPHAHIHKQFHNHKHTNTPIFQDMKADDLNLRRQLGLSNPIDLDVSHAITGVMQDQTSQVCVCVPSRVKREAVVGCQKN